MQNRRFVLPVAALALCVMYCPQPILPVLRAEFGIGSGAASLMVAFILIPLAVAPLAYGALLESVAAGRMLSASLAVLAASSLGIALAGDFSLILVLRLVQGLAIPALLTSLMTSVASASPPAGLAKNMAAYVSATIFGGFFGRLAAGVLSSLFGWRAVFFALCAALCLALVAARRSGPAAKTGFSRVSLAEVRGMLALPGLLRACGVAGCSFFVYASIPNFLPFRLTELSAASGGMPEWLIGLSYSGYLLGMTVSYLSPRLAGLLGGQRRALLAGLGVYLAATLVFAFAGVAGVFADMFAFCGGMAMVQGVAPGFVNSLVDGRKGLANGVYISCYYCGGALGAYLPGFVYRAFGWQAYVATLVLVLCLAIRLAWGLEKRR